MGLKNLTELLILAETILCLATLIVMAVRRALLQYRFVSAFLATRFLSSIFLSLLLTPHLLSLSRGTTYNCYFYLYWGSYAVEAILGLGIIISIYRLSMAPLKGLQSLGMIMFRWAASISVIIAITIAVGPHVTSKSFIMRAVAQLQQTQSVLTLCMLVFVCIAIHPMGLSFRSRIFGISLGLGVLATSDLIQAAWLPHSSSMVSALSIISSLSVCSTFAIWIGYFAFPEPERRMIMLPTTSPFFRWNQISEVLGDEPGFVAVGEVTLDMFAPAEVEIMRRASAKMTPSLAENSSVA
jgi:hypothetical protein